VRARRGHPRITQIPPMVRTTDVNHRDTEFSGVDPGPRNRHPQITQMAQTAQVSQVRADFAGPSGMMSDREGERTGIHLQPTPVANRVRSAALAFRPDLSLHFSHGLGQSRSPILGPFLSEFLGRVLRPVFRQSRGRSKSPFLRDP